MFFGTQNLFASYAILIWPKRGETAFRDCYYLGSLLFYVIDFRDKASY